MSSAGRIVVVMGVSGCGKTTLARALVDAWQATFLDADDFHSEEARAHMADGQPLTDEMRAPWVDRIAAELQHRVAQGESVVLAFSGLRREHRDRLRARGFPLRFVFLQGDKELISSRMVARSGHYMPVSLLESQFRALEVPDATESDVQVIAVALPTEEQVQEVAAILGGQG